MIKIRDLEYLDAIDTHRHFGRAAEACFVSQPTLSGQIMKLEEHLGLTLVERQTRKVMLTPAGEELVAEARKVLRAANNFEASAKALLDPFSGDLHIGLIPTLAPYLLPHIMKDLNDKLPNIKFYLHEDKTKNLLKSLDDGKLDLIILPWLEEMDKFDRYDLFEEPLVLATSKDHQLSLKEVVSLGELKDYEVLTLEDGHCLRDQALGFCFTAGAKEDHRFQATSLETLRYMVSSNMGITLLPQLATVNHHITNTINYIPFEDPKPNRQISLMLRSGYSRMQCIRAVVSSVKNSMKEVI
ncbi:DNA-binding transcriptional regulator OxyR [Pseudocolwellia sp. AS88]|uniref:DNA-binding transcriptional regulator OxyR n=1 Tax=Pseudocolwellia TaxID=2848177 RepID=UPI0026EF4970|nr:DNA-binding transcriptional regulator OxyR [Pseudocolwellia sp. AS88]MDO7084188.1 DNA-binding transcriptional regulator OxyR [Pseudocolwellia sp. AS88]